MIKTRLGSSLKFMIWLEKSVWSFVPYQSHLRTLPFVYWAPQTHLAPFCLKVFSPCFLSGEQSPLPHPMAWLTRYLVRNLPPPCCVLVGATPMRSLSRILNNHLGDFWFILPSIPTFLWAPWGQRPWLLWSLGISSEQNKHSENSVNE